MEVHPEVFAAQPILFNRGTSNHLVRSSIEGCMQFNSRNRSIPCPSAPRVLAICFDLSSITENLCTAGIVLNALDCFLKLPCPAVWRKHLKIEESEDPAL